MSYAVKIVDESLLPELSNIVDQYLNGKNDLDSYIAEIKLVGRPYYYDDKYLYKASIYHIDSLLWIPLEGNQVYNYLVRCFEKYSMPYFDNIENMDEKKALYYKKVVEKNRKRSDNRELGDH